MRAHRPDRLVPLLMGLGVLAAGCGGPNANVADRPTDLDSARDLAKAVAQKAECEGFEDFGLDADDKWAFTCQFGQRGMFVIRTAVSTQLRDAARPTGTAYKVGAFYLVTPDTTTPDLRHLQAFPGELVNG